ncbi:UDP-N-acetylenolpyruvoylglucosamine reductase [Bacteroidia bacterium]|nr:UDP-N-acetylenolpyruvoylglucosamine reductase [Bacteroidia bacterium]
MLFSMNIEENYSLLKHNTFGVNAITHWFIEYNDEEELKHIAKDEYVDEAQVIHIGRGSNILFLDEFYDGIVLHSAIKGREIIDTYEDSVIVRIGASEVWDDIVAYAIENKWYGIENLSFIPGEIGAAAVQNIGAYGQEISKVIEGVEAVSLRSGEKFIFSGEACMYDYRGSRLKGWEERLVVTYVWLRLFRDEQYQLDYNIFRYTPNLSLSRIRQHIFKTRRQKLPDLSVLGNAGSFFKNPILASDEFNALVAKYPKVPSNQHSDSEMKIPAGWLIEQCGFKGAREGNVGVYENHALVLVNHGQATGREIAAFAKKIQTVVFEKYGILLEPEVKYVGR